MASLICTKAIFWTAFSPGNFKKTLLSGYLCHAELRHESSKRHFICATEGVSFTEKSGAFRAPCTKKIMEFGKRLVFISILALSRVPDGNREAILSGLHVFCDFSENFKRPFIWATRPYLSLQNSAKRGHLSGQREAIYQFRYCSLFGARRSFFQPCCCNNKKRMIVN